MATQYISGAIIEDAQNALNKGFGERPIKQLYRNAKQAEWIVTFFIRRSSGAATRLAGAKCTVTASSDRIMIQLERYVPPAVRVMLVVCYCLFIISGVLFQIRLAMMGRGTNRTIAEKMTELVATTQQLAAARRAGGSPPPNQ